jgi:hypothetical protein
MRFSLPVPAQRIEEVRVEPFVSLLGDGVECSAG